jgi:hypothetical protein
MIVLWLILTEHDSPYYTLNDVMTLNGFTESTRKLIQEWALQRRGEAQVVEVVDLTTGRIIYTVEGEDPIDLEYINEHRRAVGRPTRPKHTALSILAEDSHRIEVFAPYGEDPWLNYSTGRDFGELVLKDEKNPLSPMTTQWVKEYFKIEPRPKPRHM